MRSPARDARARRCHAAERCRRNGSSDRSAAPAPAAPRRPDRASTRSSRRNERSGRKPVATTMRSTRSVNGLPASVAAYRKPSPCACRHVRRRMAPASSGGRRPSPALAARPSAPRSGNWSFSPPPSSLSTRSRRSAQKISVRGRFVLQFHQRQRDVDRRMAAADRPARAFRHSRAAPRRRHRECRRRCGRQRLLRREPAGRRRPSGSAASRCPTHR